MTNKKFTEVVVAALINKEGEILLSSRPEPKVYAGYWELPGGKVEEGEDLAQALSRELEEELGIIPKDFKEVDCEEFSYPHADVRLHFSDVLTGKGASLVKRDRTTGSFLRIIFLLPFYRQQCPCCLL